VDTAVGEGQALLVFTHVTSFFIGVRECFAFQGWLLCRQKPNVLARAVAFFVCRPMVWQ